MIDYPDDDELRAQSREHDLALPVLVRDIVRVVEVLNLGAKRFFKKDSVLAGSMALRCFGSPRFTVYDADFSTCVWHAAGASSRRVSRRGYRRCRSRPRSHCKRSLGGSAA